ncbi:MAG: glycoside hydrolase family 3 protein, partial [Clostridia bacterium]|nr:glycoside hydrolase family 3 protein [Clostridia bacterium]
VFPWKDYETTTRQAAAEGCVLLENHDGALPLARGARIALFGRTQMQEYHSGLGSGGLVNVRQETSLWNVLKGAQDFTLNLAVRKAYEDFVATHPYDIGDGWAGHPWFQEEFLPDAAFLRAQAEESEIAIVLIGRTAGEDKDHRPEKGSWYLTDSEETLLGRVTSAFHKTIVLLNCGSILDLSWIDRYHPDAVLLTWQGGEQMPYALYDLLSGTVSPSGHLSDTIAYAIEDYPSTPNFGGTERNLYAEDIFVGYRYFSTFAESKVRYPFGYGLSYTSFALTSEGCTVNEDSLLYTVRVQNTGNREGKTVIQCYVRGPGDALLSLPARQLVAFEKTALLQPGEACRYVLTIPLRALCAFDDDGRTGHFSCHVLQAGEYTFFIGENVRDCIPAGTLKVPETRVIAQCTPSGYPRVPFRRMVSSPDGEANWEDTPFHPSPVPAPLSAIPYSPDSTSTFASAAKEGNFDGLLARMSDEMLCTLVRGEGMSSPKVTPGTGAAFGGITPALRALGVPVCCCSDGPSGIRMDCGNVAFLLPSGTCLACTWNPQLVEALFRFEGLELRKNHVDILLGPGVNIHRHPLNGRTFEYFSEDPALTGRMAAAELRGLHFYGVTGAVKHYACNNQETNRRKSDSIVSARALREIYLRPFEIAVQEGKASTIMTSYNPINGVWASSHHDLVTDILRGDFGFTGFVMTDWWAACSEEGMEPSGKNTRAMVRAQNDIYMVVNDSASNSSGDNLLESLADGTLSRADLQRCARNLLRFLAFSPCFIRESGTQDDVEDWLRSLPVDEETPLLALPELYVDGEATLPGDSLQFRRGDFMLQVRLAQKGTYGIDIRLRAREGQSGVAQLPVSVLLDRVPLGTHVVRGDETEYTLFSLRTRPIERRPMMYFCLHVPMGGVDFDSIR